MKRPLYVPQYTNTENSKGQPLHQSATISPASDIYSFDENEIQQKTDSDLGEIPSNNQLVPVKSSSPLKLQICLIIFGSIVLLAAIAAIITSVLLNRTSSTSTVSSTSTRVTTAGVTTTTALYSCSNFTVTMNWDYPGNDIVSVSPMTFGVCCAWCLATSSCTTFVLIVASSTCYIKTSRGSGGGVVTNYIAATR